MIAEQVQRSSSLLTTTKYYQFSTILEHVIDCFHTIVSDESNPYHPPLAWLTRKQPKPPDDELFLELHDECSKQVSFSDSSATTSDSIQLSSSTRARLEKCPQQLRREIVSRTRDGCSPLFMACKNGLNRIIKYLLDVCGADVEQRGRFEALEDQHVHYVTPIWIAAVSGHLETVRLLIDRGANVNSVSDTGSTPLRSVCFLCKDDDGSEESDDLSSFDYSFGGVPDDISPDVYMEIVHLLVKNGAHVSRPNHNGGTCLINSVHNYKLTEYIINQGADIDAADNHGRTALHYSIQQHRVNVSKLLLARGANPFLRNNNRDDALQLSCIEGHDELFQHLIENYNYSRPRLSDAYKLLGSSILEIHNDLARVRRYWSKSLDIRDSIVNRQSDRDSTGVPGSPNMDSAEGGFCDTRLIKAYGATSEFIDVSQLQMLTVDDFRIQSLLISERVLGSNHRETIQRLLYRGTFYINSLRPDRCLDLWIYALKLRLDHSSIFHFESIFAAQAITKLFLDLFCQHQHRQVKFDDVHDVLSMLTQRLDNCERQLSWRPRSCLHEDIYDLLLGMIVNLLLILRCVRRQPDDHARADKIVLELVGTSPRTTKGSTLLHICVAPSMFDGDIHRSLQMASDALKAVAAGESSTSSPNRSTSTANSSGSSVVSDMTRHVRVSNVGGHLRNGSTIGDQSTATICDQPPVVELIMDLIDAGLDVDLTNHDGLSALQILCLTSSIRVTDKKKIIQLLVQHGAHIDRRAQTPEQDEQIRQTLRECGVPQVKLVTLKCLAARRVSELKIKFDKSVLAKNLSESIAIH